MTTETELDALIRRLRQLALVDVDALLAGTAAAERADLLECYQGDLRDALRCAAEQSTALVAELSSGPDPVAPFVAGIATGELRRHAASATAQLETRSRRARILAVVDDARAALLARLAELTPTG